MINESADEVLTAMNDEHLLISTFYGIKTNI